MTSRPLSERSEVVQDLYADISELKPVVGRCGLIFEEQQFFFLIYVKFDNTYNFGDRK